MLPGAKPGEMGPAGMDSLQASAYIASEDFYLIWFTLNPKQLQCVVGSDFLGFDIKYVVVNGPI